MQKYLKRAIQMGALCASFIVGICLAEDFLLPEKSAESAITDRKRVSGSSLKQEIAELCAVLLQQTSKNIEQSARLQQLLYARINELLNNDKQGYLHNANKKELQEYLEAVRSLKAQLDKHEADLLRSFKLLAQSKHKKS